MEWYATATLARYMYPLSRCQMKRRYILLMKALLGILHSLRPYRGLRAATVALSYIHFNLVNGHDSETAALIGKKPLSYYQATRHDEHHVSEDCWYLFRVYGQFRGGITFRSVCAFNCVGRLSVWCASCPDCVSYPYQKWSLAGWNHITF